MFLLYEAFCSNPFNILFGFNFHFNNSFPIV